jgi:hypothetical protein
VILILGSRSLDPPILWREGVVVNARVNCRALMGRKRVVDRKMDMVGIDELMCSGEGKYKKRRLLLLGYCIWWARCNGRG